MCLVQGPQRSGACETRFLGPSVASQPLSHCAPCSGLVPPLLFAHTYFRQYLIIVVKHGWIQRGEGSGPAPPPLFVWFDSLRPINNLSVIKGRVFLGWTSTKLGLMFLLKDTTQWRRWGLQPAAPRSRVKHSTTEPLRSPLAHPLKNQKNIGFHCNTRPDPLKKHEATKPAFNVGPSSARQRKAI